MHLSDEQYQHLLDQIETLKAQRDANLAIAAQATTAQKVAEDRARVTIDYYDMAMKRPAIALITNDQVTELAIAISERLFPAAVSASKPRVN